MPSPGELLDTELDRLEALPDPLADDLRGFAAELDETPRTTELYVRNCRLLYERGLNVREADVETINNALNGLHDGGDGLSANTMITYQSAVRAFLRWRANGADAEAVTTFTPDTTPRFDERDMFTEAEVFDLRSAVGRTRNPTRNRAFLELLLHTGQRLRALLTLRVDDVDPAAGKFYLNADVDGLKRARERGRERPLFGSQKYVREWVDAHPTGEGWLFVGEPSNPSSGDGHWSRSAASEMLANVAERAGVDKPVNPHTFRHYCISVLRRDYDLSWDRINALVGVKRGSDMPQTTYSHIDDSELLADIEAELGYADGRERNRFAPPVCPTCNEVLKSDWRKCPVCDAEFAPDADDGEAELEWLADQSAVSYESFKRIVGRAVEKELTDGDHLESS